MNDRELLVGINYPWLDYAWDFGDPPPAWVNPLDLAVWREQKRARIVEDFQAFAEMGFFAVRWFLLGDGTNYGVDLDAPRQIDHEWSFEPLPESHPFNRQFLSDFQFVLETCARVGLKLAPSLIDFHWCHRGSTVGGNPGIVKGGRYQIVRDPGKREAFFNQLLEPLLDLSMKYRDAIYAWELINEPEWVIARPSLTQLIAGVDQDKTVSQKEMKSFIAQGMERINRRVLADGSPAFQSTVGFAHWGSVEDWSSADLGVRLHQFHYYAQAEADLPQDGLSLPEPCFIGEFATAVEREWPELKRSGLEQTISNRLRAIEKNKYQSAFLWSAKAVDLATRWTAEDQRDTIAYLNPGQGRPSGEVA